MSNQMRFLIAVLLTATLGVVLTVAVALKSPAAKWTIIERHILNEVAQKIIGKTDVSADEERIAKENKYVLIKGHAFMRLNNKKTDEALALLTWIRERSDEDPQIDYYLAQAWQLQDSADNAAKYYQRVVERSASLSEILTALDYLNKKDNKPYVEVVRNFIMNQNKGSRFAELIATKPPRDLTLDDKTFVLLLALEVVEGKMTGIVPVANGPNMYYGSEILKPYQMVEDGGTRLDLQRLEDDLVGKDNPKRKEAQKNTVGAAAEPVKESKEK